MRMTTRHRRPILAEERAVGGQVLAESGVGPTSDALGLLQWATPLADVQLLPLQAILWSAGTACLRQYHLGRALHPIWYRASR